MSRRLKFIALTIVLTIFVLTGWLLLRGRRGTAPTPALDVPTSANSAEITAPLSPAGQNGVSQRTAQEQERKGQQVALEGLSRSFVERYGSYSSQSNFENITDLYPFMTERMRTEAEAFVASKLAKQGGALATYSGMTTRVLSIKTLSHLEREASLQITTQRIESQAGSPSQVAYQDMEVTLKNVGGEWKIDLAVWK